ncbi:hypothetical protein [Streptomyces sp. NPDC058773]|uniref:hypothetical protein n=1 Tax=Streptomyces sp. NPDC058773 TaxID=3346632 RepID=UPI0036B626C4
MSTATPDTPLGPLGAILNQRPIKGRAELTPALSTPEARREKNGARIKALSKSQDDCEALALLFSDQGITDDNTVPGRLKEILAATEHWAIPGLQTGIAFSDRHFKGDQKPGGEGFRDPWESSRNQVGHFLTAVGMSFEPAVVRRRVGGITLRTLLDAPEAMLDSEVVRRLVIGHEKAADPSLGDAAIGALVGAAVPVGITGGSPVPGILGGAAIAVIRAFRAQFQAVTQSDIIAWDAALAALGNNTALNLGAAEPELRKIPIVYENRGNSIQDLRLSLCGWYLGRAITAGRFASGEAIATWVRKNLHD